MNLISGREDPAEQLSPYDEQRLIASLRQAIEQDELRLHYQPRYRCEQGQSTLFETLVRWRRPGVGLLYPTAFLPLAEKHGLIFNISLWIFRQACRDLKWMKQHISPQCQLSVNLSLRECESLFHAQQLYDICHGSGLQLADFEFEITENVCPRDTRKIRAFCDTLAELGARFSLDDFGTSYSPLSNLYNLPVSAIKIDKSFVKGVCDDYTLHILISNLVHLAKDLNISVVAEGVENARQVCVLEDMGCDELQGNFICEPKRLLALRSFMANLDQTKPFIH